MKNTLNRQLKLAFATLFALIALISGMAAWYTLRAQADAEHLYLNTRASAELGRATSALWQLRYGFPQFMVVGDDAKKKIVEDEAKWVKEIDSALAAYEATGPNAEQAQALKALREVYKQYTDARPKWFALMLEGKTEEAKDWRAKTTTPFGAGTVKGFGDLIELQARGAAAEKAALDAQAGRVRALVVAVCVVTLMAVVALALWITRLLTGPVAQATQVARNIAAGKLDTDVKGAGAGPLGDLLAALCDMQTSLSNTVARVRQNAEGVAEASEQIAQGNSALSGRTEQQASSLQETAASMEQLGSTVRQNADNAQQANELASGASTVAVKGGDVVGQVVETMKGINDSSKKIADIITVIDGIAFQTNILALNAAVEAARAGEQGRGFAVVAGEVRNLAQRSAEAAKETKGLITARVERAEQGTSLVDEAGATMTEIVDSVQHVTDIIGEITAASSEQSDGIGTVNTSVVQLDHMTQQNAALVEQSAAAAESLKEQAVKLTQLMGMFKLDRMPA